MRPSGESVRFASVRSRVRIPPSPPRRCGRHIVRSDFFTKVTSHAFCRSSSPNRTRFAGLRFGFLLQPRVSFLSTHPTPEQSPLCSGVFAMQKHSKKRPCAAFSGTAMKSKRVGRYRPTCAKTSCAPAFACDRGAL